MTTGETIQNLRKQQGYSQEQLANMLHVSRQTVSKWESDTHLPELEKCMELCRIFNVSLDELLLGEETKKTNMSDEELQKLLNQLKPQRNKKHLLLLSIVALLLIGIIGKILIDNRAMSKQLESLLNSYYYLSSQIESQNDSIQNTISEALKNKDSFIQDFQFEVHDYNQKNHTVDVSFQVIPKKINKNNTMTLHLQSENKKDIYVDLTLSKNLYTGKASLPLENYKSVNILLKNSTTTSQMSLDIYLDLLDKFTINVEGNIPGITPRFHTENKQTFIQYECYGSYLINEHSETNSILVDGKLMENYLNSIVFELYVNDQLVDTQDGSINESVILKGNIQNSDHVVLKETLTDELGLVYHLTLEDFFVSIDKNNIDTTNLLTNFDKKIEFNTK